MSMNRRRAAELGRETVLILQAGRYTTPAGQVIEIADRLRRAVEGTRSYPADVGLPALPPRDPLPGPTRIEVVNESTLAAALRLIQEGRRPVALNFASAKHPGGGFLSGARAQEESLARSSGLFACLDGRDMYAVHRARPDPMYTDHAIYSPDVPVFRADDGALLPEPYACAFLTAPAVNAKVVLERDRTRRPEIRRAMQRRTRRVLSVAALHGHDALVLGAWGCGVFGNDSREIAELFHHALRDDFPGVFARVVFAILDWSPEQRFIGPFRRTFAPTA